MENIRKTIDKTRLMGLLILSALVLLSNVSFSQEKFKFTYESGAFIGEVQDLMQHSANKIVARDSEQFMPALVDRWNVGRFDKNAKDNIKEITQRMSDENLVNDLVFLNFYYVVNELAFSTLDDKSISNFLIYSNKLYQEKGKAVFKEHVKYSKEFFGKNVLNTVSNMKWYLRCERYKLPSDSDFVVEIENGSIVCASRQDSIVVKQTNGVFRKNEMTFSGKGGVTTWQRFKLDEDRVFAKLSSYSIDLKTVDVSADSALLYNKNLFDEPLLGCFNDKSFANRQNAKDRYPSFVSYKDGCDVTDMFRDIVLRGVFGMRGAEFCISGKKNSHAVMSVMKNNDTVAKIETKSFIIKDKRLVSDGVLMRILLDNDSIYHNGVAMQYDNNSREFVFYNAEKLARFAPFFDSYHKINIYSDAMFWNVDENLLKFKKIMPHIKESKAFFRSYRYFRYAEWERLRGMDDYNPLNIIGEYMGKYKTNVLDISLLTAYFKRDEQQVISSILQLEEQGYLTYDAENKVAYPNERMYHALDVLMTNADYDIIKIESVTKDDQPNMELDISSFDLTVNGVTQIVLSNARNVNIIPNDNKIIVKKGLDIDFSGMMMAGLFEFYTHDGTFNYNKFAIDLPNVDSVAFYVKRKGREMTGTMLDYARVKNVITDVSGVVYIDKTNNMSGKDDNSEYPVFDCQKESHVEFRDSRFVLEPFVVDSLFTFSTENFNLEGYFTSDVFPDFDEKLRVMDDYSLGFEHYTGEEGIAMFDGTSKFHNMIHVSDGEFYGNGTVDYMTSFVESDHIDFFSDSLHCAKGKFEMLAVDDANLSYPYAAIDVADVKMSSRDNKMYINTLNQKMSIYENSTFSGLACLQPTGFTGNGVLNFDAATVKSDGFKFENTRFEADAEMLTVKDDTGADAFIVTNYWISVDFAEQIGKFRKIDETSRITFPQNEFYCNIDNAEWKIDDATLTMSGDYNGNLVSLNPKQDMLTFNTSDVYFDIDGGMIATRNVDTIMLADAAVVIPDGIVSVGRKAAVQTLTNSVIIADTSYKLHRFYDAEVEIKGKNDFLASGKLDFYDHDKNLTTLNFNKIYVDQDGKTRATCVIDEYDNFLVGNDMLYKGEVKVESTRVNLEFDGYFMLINQCINDFQWFKSDVIFDPDNIVIPLNDESFAYNSGMFYDTINREFFVGFLSNNAVYQPHKAALQIKGELSYDSRKRCYKTSELSLQTDNCIITGEGKIDLGFIDQFVQFNSDGKFVNDISKDEIILETTSSLDFIFDDALLEQMAQIMRQHADTLKNWTVKDKHSIVIDNLKMKWFNSLHCFINVTPIHLKSVLKTSVDMIVDGNILLNYNDEPSLALYMRCSEDKWFFFCYQDGLLTSVSSDNDYINHLQDVKEKQRHFVNKNTGEEFEYSIGTFEEVSKFLQIVGYLKGNH